MAYFANGTAGDMYSQTYCVRCANWRARNDGRGHGCAIIDLHLLWNYAAVGKTANETKCIALEHFIPTVDGFPGECVMFLETVPADVPGQMRLGE